MKAKIRKAVLRESQKGGERRVKGKKEKGGNHPPKKSKTVSKEIRIILAYSEIKKRAKVIPEYSTLKPETSSDSPSVRSKGARLVSARAETKNMMKAGNNGIINQTSF
jgi:hypothetical protein